MIEHILFDLDGTLTDPGEGITRSVQHALKAFGIAVENHRELDKFVGPPLDVAFAEYYGFSPEQCGRAIDEFRVYFRDTGILQNELFPGIPELLAGLRQAGKTLYVATSKPTVFANQILERFGLAQYFTSVTGSPMDHAGTPKGDIVREVLEKHRLLPHTAVMVGDREHDIIGARQNGLASVGVLFGYGSREEFEQAGADYIVEDVPALETLLMAL